MIDLTVEKIKTLIDHIRAIIRICTLITDKHLKLVMTLTLLAPVVQWMFNGCSGVMFYERVKICFNVSMFYGRSAKNIANLVLICRSNGSAVRAQTNGQTDRQTLPNA